MRRRGKGTKRDVYIAPSKDASNYERCIATAKKFLKPRTTEHSLLDEDLIIHHQGCKYYTHGIYRDGDIMTFYVYGRSFCFRNGETDRFENRGWAVFNQDLDMVTKMPVIVDRKHVGQDYFKWRKDIWISKGYKEKGINQARRIRVKDFETKEPFYVYPSCGKVNKAKIK